MYEIGLGREIATAPYRAGGATFGEAAMVENLLRARIRSIASALLLSLSAGMTPAHAEVNLGTCSGSDCVWLVEDNSVVLSKSLTELEKSRGQLIDLPVPPHLEGLPPDHGVGLLNAKGKLDGMAYFDHAGTHLIFKADGGHGLEVPLGVTLIKTIPERESPQIILSMPTLSGGLAQIYVQSQVDAVPEPTAFFLMFSGLVLIVGARVRTARQGSSA